MLFRSVNDSYARWISNFEKNDKLKPIDADRFHYQPIISIVIPVYNVSKKLLIECIESVVTQSYPNWQLCIADDCSTMPEVTKVLERYKNHPKIDIIYRKENGHISKATNSALALAKGEFVGFLDCDDTLASNALFEVVQALNNNSALDFIYTDEDKISEDGRNRHMPHFKPDWSPDTLMSLMYTCHFSVYRKSIVDKIGGLREGYEGSQDYDFVLRFTEQIPVSHIKHIPKVLYHWRERKESTATDGGAKEYIMDAAFKAKEDAIKRRGSQAKIELLEGLYQYRVNYIPMNNPKVGIVILSKDNPDIFMRCIESIVEKTRYSNYQMILVDNGSNNQNKDRYLSLCESNDCLYHYQKMYFNFSRMCNIGATKIECEYLLFLNDDVEVLDEEWLERTLGHAQQKHTGAVGAKLLYPNSTIIQHTGVLNIANGPSHSLVGYDDNELFYFARNKLDYNYLAVTAACIMISKQKFEEIDGFNEDLSVAYNDVDLCFKLVEHGYYNVVRNDVVLYHYESFSRGNDQIDKAKMQRLINEREKLFELHPNFSRVEKRDPFYSENLTQTNVNFAYNVSEIARKKNEYSVSKLANFTPSNQIKYNIESLETGDQISVQGWAYLEGEKWNNYRKVSILLDRKSVV